MTPTAYSQIGKVHRRTGGLERTQKYETMGHKVHCRTGGLNHALLNARLFCMLKLSQKTKAEARARQQRFFCACVFRCSWHRK